MEQQLFECKGSVILFSEEANYCLSCSIREECKVEVERNKAELAEIFKVKRRKAADPTTLTHQIRVMGEKRAKVKAEREPVAAPKPIKEPVPVAKPIAVKVIAAAVESANAGKLRPPLEATLLPGLPVKVRQEVTRWHNKCIDPSAILRGENPFALAKGLFFANVAAKTWLEKEGMSRKEFLSAVNTAIAIERGDPWAESSLNSNMNIFLGAMRACEVELVK